MNLSAAVAQWQSLLGAAQVLSAQAAAQAYGHDTSAARRHVLAALRIQDRDSLPAVMRIASAHRVPVYPISTGKNWGYGSALPVRDGCVIVDLSALRQIVDFDAELGVVTLEPGVTQAMLADFLAAGRHPYLVPVTGAGPSASLLGNALERGYGVTPYTDHFGAVTDLEAVLPDGSLYRSALREAGGQALARLFKWGIGPYCNGLFTQSGFGIVTQLSIVLARQPECVKVCLFSLKDDVLLEPAVAAIRLMLAQLPGTIGAINLMNQHRVLSMSAPYPREQVGADGLLPPSVVQALGRQYQVLPWTGFVTLYGTQRVVRAAQKDISAALVGVASRRLFITPEQAGKLARWATYLPGAWGQRLARMSNTLAQSLALVAGQPNETALPLAYWRHTHPPPLACAPPSFKDPARDGCGLSWYAPLVPMRPAGVRAYVNMVTQVTSQHAMEPLITLTSLNERLFDSTVALLFERDQPAAVAAAAACQQALLVRGRAQGWFPYRVGIDSMSTLADLTNESQTFQLRLRQHLDPHDLMAPGRYRE